MTRPGYKCITVVQIALAKPVSMIFVPLRGGGDFLMDFFYEMEEG